MIIIPPCPYDDDQLDRMMQKTKSLLFLMPSSGLLGSLLCDQKIVFTDTPEIRTAATDDAITDQWAHVDRTYPDASPIIEAWLRALSNE